MVLSNRYFFDDLDGIGFEEFLKRIFENLGYTVSLTPKSNDYGADLLLQKEGIKKVVQAKRYSEMVGISAVQELVGAIHYYTADSGVVVTNNYFTPNAIELAAKSNIELWDREQLIINTVNSYYGTTNNKIDNKAVCKTIFEYLDTSNGKETGNLILGIDDAGKPLMRNLKDIQHLFIKGSAETGKTNLLHCLILQLITEISFNYTRILLVDTKKIEFGMYQYCHALVSPIVYNYNKVTAVFEWALAEILKRYNMFADNSVGSLDDFNARMRNEEKQPKLVLFIDEIGDALNDKRVFNTVSSIIAKGSRVGIHLVLATHTISNTKPLENIFPSSMYLSKSNGQYIAITSITNGDNKIQLLIPHVQVKDVEGLVLALKERQSKILYNVEDMYDIDVLAARREIKKASIKGDYDALFLHAVDVVFDTGQASVSIIQRKLRLGYSTAARLVDMMEERGIIGTYEDGKLRMILITKEQWEEQKRYKFT